MKSILLPFFCLLCPFLSGQPNVISSSNNDSIKVEERWEGLTFDKRLTLGIVLANQIEQRLITENLHREFNCDVYPGVSSAVIVFGGHDANFRGSVRNDTMFIYNSALDYLDKAASTILHEYNAHFKAKQNDKIPNTKNKATITVEKNPFYGTTEDPYGTPEIEVITISTPTSTLLEEIYGYRLEAGLHEKGLIKLKDEDIQKIMNFLKSYEAAFKER